MCDHSNNGMLSMQVCRLLKIKGWFTQYKMFSLFREKSTVGVVPISLVSRH